MFIGGIVSFAGVVMFLRYSAHSSGKIIVSEIPFPTAVNSVFFLICVILSWKIPAKMFASVSSEISGELTFEKSIEKIRTIMIIRIALLECPAFVGLALMIVQMREGDVYLLNLIPCAVMTAVLLVLMPSKERIVRWFEMIA
jgi:hypothetical protein